ncbi:MULTISPECIES: hypothetical protein [Pseudomonas]|uniref:Uncharacterized protein n=2 Tax=Pseudomonas lactis TaxID=1615674 RepID=A0ABS9FKX7_9PSED|nr:MULTISPECIES: hypothetical protein [Pseudomonas]MBI6975091.1 hypothetical protein [Pseudomonas lactis]MCF5003906.1 hypothetical protein [Pseudomonas lactis]MCF5009203.1 hypothetical protein [Pseudomonas lactis]MCF5014665.1 hypothetical protein [Pseudomonas lactis]MCF5018254.1 hypothetical protein [Pseudomonas lactis]
MPITLGMRAAWFAEIEPFPSAVLAHHYPDFPNNGDMTILTDLVRTDADKGVTASVAAKNLGMHIKRVTLIAQENGFKFADTP